MRIDTMRMSTTSHQPIGGRRSSVVTQAMSSSLPAAGRRALPAYFFRYAHHLHHFLYRMYTHDMRAGKHSGRDGGGRAPVALRRGTIVNSLPEKRFPARADEQRAAERLCELR